MSTTDAGLLVDQGPISTGFAVNGAMHAYWEESSDTIVSYRYFTPQDAFGDVERGSPLPYALPRDRRREVGLERETWRLAVVADPMSDMRPEHSLELATGMALDFAGLLRLGHVW